MYIKNFKGQSNESIIAIFLLCNLKYIINSRLSCEMYHRKKPDNMGFEFQLLLPSNFI